MKLHVFCDGGSRGNPGPAACAFVVYSDDRLLHKAGKYLGINTNNYAEYSAVLLAMEWIKESSGIEEVLFTLDSELVVKQLNGEYKVKSTSLQPFFTSIKSIQNALPFNTIFTHSMREENKESDALVNEILDDNK